MKAVQALSILHVDDEPGFPKLIQCLVSNCNLRPTFQHFGSVADAIHYLEQASTKSPDLILSDFDMQGASGLELLVWIRRSQFSQVPVVFVSGSEDAKRIDATLQAGANGWIPKSPNRTLEQCAAQITHYCGGRCGQECQLIKLFSSTSSSQNRALN